MKKKQPVNKWMSPEKKEENKILTIEDFIKTEFNLTHVPGELDFYFVEGYIDRWTGDMINDPNNEKESQFCLSAFASYYRLNSGKWINERSFQNRIFDAMFSLEACEKTATEVWESCSPKQSLQIPEGIERNDMEIVWVKHIRIFDEQRCILRKSSLEQKGVTINIRDQTLLIHIKPIQ
jgi:hypothetical protein